MALLTNELIDQIHIHGTLPALILDAVLSEALRSVDFKRKLIEDPRGVLSSNGLEFPLDSEIRLCIDDKSTVNVVEQVLEYGEFQESGGFTSSVSSAEVAPPETDRTFESEIRLKVHRSSRKLIVIPIPYIDDRWAAGLKVDAHGQYSDEQAHYWMGNSPPSPPQSANCTAGCSKGCYTIRCVHTCAGICNTSRPCTTSVRGGTCF